MKLQELCNTTIEIAKKVGSYIRNERNQFGKYNYEVKSHNSFVTKVDKEAERIIVNGLEQIIPEAGFIAEEGTSEKTSENYNWVIDPLDGTTNFIHGLPIFAVSIALMHKQEIVLGVVYEINNDECFYAVKNGGAFMNGQEIHVSKTPTLKDALLATGFPYYDYDKLESYTKLLGHFAKTSQGLRRFGSAATDLAYVACGRIDAYYEYSLSPWDVAAGALIVQEAGGSVSTFKNTDNYIFGKEIVATNKVMHAEIIQSIGMYFVD